MLNEAILYRSESFEKCNYTHILITQHLARGVFCTLEDFRSCHYLETIILFAPSFKVFST